MLSGSALRFVAVPGPTSRDIRIYRLSGFDFFGKLMHLDIRGYEPLAGKDEMKEEGEENDDGDGDGDDHVDCVLDKLDLKRACQHKVRWVGGDEDGRGDISHSELGVDPGSRMGDVTGDARHVGEKGSAGEDDGIIADEASEDEEEGVHVEVEAASGATAPLQDPEGEVSNESGGVDGDGDIREGEEEDHDLVRRDVVGSNNAAVNFFATNGANSEQEEIRHNRGRDKVQGQTHTYPMLSPVTSLLRRTNGCAAAGRPAWRMWVARNLPG